MKTKEEITGVLETCNSVIENFNKEIKNLELVIGEENKDGIEELEYMKDILVRFNIRKRVLQWVLGLTEEDKHIIDWI